VKVIRHLDTERCQQYQNLYISNAGNTPLSTTMDLSPQPGPSTPLDQGYQKKRSRTQQEDSIGNAKHIKEDSHWLHPTATHNRYSALSDDENVDHLQKVASDSTPKRPPIFVSDVITIPPLLQLLDQTVKQSYEIKALA
jgi:hypothetical protein